MSATPGPWHVGGADNATIYDRLCQRIANSFEGVMVTQHSDEECRANARLIAAAPDLADALFGLLAAVGEIGLTQAQIEAMGKACEAGSQALIKSGRVTG